MATGKRWELQWFPPYLFYIERYDTMKAKLITILFISVACVGAKDVDRVKRVKTKFPNIPGHIVEQIMSSKGWHHVTASREGLVGETTASGFVIKKDSVFVALPHRKSLGEWVAVRYKDLVMVCKVKDVGPHSIYDDYWNHSERGPLAEQGVRVPKRWGKAKNKAGIDLSDGLWDWFGIKRGVGLVNVKWKFIERNK